MPPDTLLIAQGVYYLFSGIWPLVHIRSFLAVTGPKTDLWLVRAVGLLVTVIGGALLISGIHNRAPLEIVFLAIASQLALTMIDVYHAAKKQIPKIYLLDAFVELLFLTGWLLPQ